MRPCLLAFPCFVLSAAGQKKCRPRPPRGTGLPLSSFTRPLGSTPSSASTAPTFLPIQSVAQSSEHAQPASPPTGSISFPPLPTDPVQPSTSIKLSKKGLGWATKNPLLASKLAVGTLSWYFHWENPPVPAIDLPYYPMLWGEKKLDMFLAVMAALPKLPDAILGLNEPDIPGQGTASPQRAAELWMQYIEPYAKQGVRLGAPAPAFDMKWLRDFLDACSACTIDFLQVHVYGSANVDSFKETVAVRSQFRNRTTSGMVWITEYGITAKSKPTADQVHNFVEETMNWLETVPYVEKTAFFGAWDKNPDTYTTDLDSMITSEGDLTTVGKLWTS